MTGEPATQNERWNRILKPVGLQFLWEQKSWLLETSILTSQDGLNPDQLHKYMTDQTRLRIEGSGYVQLVKGPTRFWQQTRPSLIDQAWTNSP